MTLPPSGLALAGMLAFYVIAGLFGRDPWKGEDAIHIGATWNIIAHSDWLSPELAGRVFNEPPLYYWSAAITGKLFSWLLALHDAIRLASGLWIALALAALYYAGRELYGKERAAAAPLLLAGSTGLILHAHDAQPMLVALTAYCGTLAAITVFVRKPRLAAGYYGLSLAGCLLGAGIAPTLPLIAAGPLAIWLMHAERSAWRTCLLGWLIFIVLALPWPIALGILEPHRLNGWLLAEWAQLASTPTPLLALGSYLGRLPTLAFPAVFIAAWTLWLNRKRLIQHEIALPLAILALTLVMLVIAYHPQELPALLLLPPLALLATPGALALRRGATNALDWFAMMAFSFFVILAWVGWSALTLGWPQKLAQRTVILRPGFVGQIEPIAIATAVICTLWWFWMIFSTPRSPYRSLLHWAMGFTIFWALLTLLWLPWFDYGRSYRPVAQALARQLPREQGCLAEMNLGDTQRASIAYFSGLEAKRFRTDTPCEWLIVQNRTPTEITRNPAWQKVWEGSRPGERRERFTLYRKQP
ncbi:MAG: hypothetical protein H6R18_1408 [Proteobacteria bacterium]|nr:hypothetical protein [Pseudomonadota bacterium]